MVPSDPAMSHTPADEPDSLRRYDVICQSVSLTVTSLVVLMRALVKFLVIHSPTKDDYACIVAWVRRSSLAALMNDDLIACVASIIRLVLGIQTMSTIDRTYDWFPEFLWTTAEISCGIIAGSLPVLPAFFRHMFGNHCWPIKRDSSEHPSNQRKSREGIAEPIDSGIGASLHDQPRSAPGVHPDIDIENRGDLQVETTEHRGLGG
ncbi:hypothetical protein BDV23DRAFT_186703 [Aspergillus alliaceus]|uniref:Rhodopsin domain-containing protein n=1 Tax=Petromyces alliaceus TaxID=209559 RepID=A0A5N7BZ26_PETAA|nr:hypothetical protein BDV23DRAFT_186703 [Aspergillus alliaceus]